MRTPWTAALLATLALSPALAEWMNVTEEVPAERLLANTRARIEAAPADPQGHYVLGRLHSLLWARGTESLHVVPPKEDGLTGFAPWESVQYGEDQRQQPVDEKAYAHLRDSVTAYRRAVQLAPDRALFRLGLGWMLEQGSRHAGALGAPPGDAAAEAKPAMADKFALVTLIESLADPAAAAEASEKLVGGLEKALPMLVEARAHQNPEVRREIVALLARRWEDQARAEYRAAYDLTVADDRKSESFGPRADVCISREAGEGLLRLAEARSKAGGPAVDVTDVAAVVAELRLRPQAITPLVFPLEAQPGTLASLLAPGRTTAFDLAGDGVPTRWTWVGPDAGLLVWDPTCGGRIESGRQLIGAVTWWMFWEDGFQALAALDDDRDGRLTGAELAGLAVWRDTDGDGVSAPGEVTPVAAAGITAIETAAGGRSEGALWHPAGVRRADGSTRPLYDWVAEERR